MTLILKKDKYTKKDLFELLSRTYYDITKFDYSWLKKALTSDEAAEEEFKRCEPHYSRIFNEMNQKLPKNLSVLLGSSPSLKSAGYTINHYYSHEYGYYTMEFLNDGISTD